MNRIRMPLIVNLALALGACAPAPAGPAAPQSITLTDGMGNEVSLAQPARRIVSLAPSNTEILFALDAGTQIVGRDSFSDFPASAADIADVGGGFTALNMELILSRKPDLVLAAPLTPPEQIADLEKVGLTVYVVPNPKNFDQLYDNLEAVARLTGRETEAATLVASLRGRAKAVTDKVATAADRPLVYYELDATDPNAPYTSGPDTFVDLLIRSAGGRNFGASLNGEWVQVSVEELLASQPDLIVLGDNTYGGVTPEQVGQRTGWDSLKAVQDGRIAIFDDNLVSRPGPRLVDGLEAMAKLLHPDLFP
jgi:iron complex transport system substrate-binding protein